MPETQCSHRSSPKDPEGRGHRRDRLFAAHVIDPVATTDVYSGRSAQAWRVACHRHESDHSCVQLVLFAGVAFLWFIGVLRARLGQLEDRFFASVFFGSALSFLAMLFAAAAVVGAVILVASVSEPSELISSATFRFARAVSYIIMNVYAIKMAAVFMISTSTVVIPNWYCSAMDCLSRIVTCGDTSDRELFH